MNWVLDVMDEMESMKQCEHCDDDFDPSERGRAKGHCRPCSVAYRQARRYGLSIARMNAILRAQDDECAICGEAPGDDGMEGISYWHIDHDHACCNRGGSCGRCVRGLLCKVCNLRGVSWYERLPVKRRDWSRLNEYLSNPPAQRPEAQVSTWGDLQGIRGRDGAFAGWRSDRPIRES